MPAEPAKVPTPRKSDEESAVLREGVGPRHPNYPTEDPLRTRTEFLDRMRAADKEVWEAAWGEFQRNYWAPLTQWAKRHGLTDVDAETIANEAMFTWWNQCRKFEHRGQGSFRAWLQKVIKYKSMELHRKQSARPVDYIDLADLAVESPTTDLNLEDAIEIVRRHYASKPASKAFRAWEMRVLEGLSSKEVASLLGYSKVNTIDVYKNKIEAEIRKVYGELPKLKH